MIVQHIVIPSRSEPRKRGKTVSKNLLFGTTDEI